MLHGEFILKNNLKNFEKVLDIRIKRWYNTLCKSREEANPPGLGEVYPFAAGEETMYTENGFKIYALPEAPFRLYGLAVADREARKFYRLPEFMLEKMPQYDFLGRRSVGGRARFATDSRRILIRMTLDACREDVNIPLTGSAGADVYLGAGKTASFLGYIAPAVHTDGEITVEKIFTKGPGLETVTVNLPRNDLLLALEIGVEADARLAEAPSYRVPDPVVFYGSSITEGGCACRVGCSCVNLVSRWLDADFWNFGFSGKARGEREFAEYIASLEHISAFVYDYDHNAPDAEHLRATHEAFFQTVRAAHPHLPVVMLSRPDTDKDPADAAARRDIIRATYERARAAGDGRVWFLDGGAFFGPEGRAECTVDGTHPNALGFMRMARSLYPVLERILYGV